MQRNGRERPPDHRALSPQVTLTEGQDRRILVQDTSRPRALWSIALWPCTVDSAPPHFPFPPSSPIRLPVWSVVWQAQAGILPHSDCPCGWWCGRPRLGVFVTELRFCLRVPASVLGSVSAACMVLSLSSNIFN